MKKFNGGILQKHQTQVSVLNRFTDMILVTLLGVFVLACNATMPDLTHWVLVFTVGLSFHFTAEIFDLYRSWRGVSFKKELQLTAITWVIVAALGFMAWDTLLPNEPLESVIKIQWFMSVIMSLVLYRVLLRFMLRILRERGFNTRRVAIAGAGDLGIQLAKKIEQAPWMGLRISGFYDDWKSDAVVIGDKSKTEFPVLGTMLQLIEDAKAGAIDKIYIALPSAADARVRWLVDQLSDSCSSVYIIPDVFVFELLHAKLEDIAGLPSISIFDSPMDGPNAIVKRVEDIVLSILILAFIAVPMFAIALGVKLSSKGPVFFKQRRYGIDGRSIEVWKFRSMTVMENGDTVVQAKKGDVRITPFGAFLRRTSLDELPQFINVLKGDMSIVGPRPHAVAHNEMYRRLINGYMLRHKVKPGITGWAQINGWRGETDTLDKMQKRIEFDLDYIRQWSLLLDIKIVFLTIFKGFIDKNAY